MSKSTVSTSGNKPASRRRRSPSKPAKPYGLTVKSLCEPFMNARLHRLETGELSPRSFHDDHSAVKRIADVFGRNRLVDDL